MSEINDLSTVAASNTTVGAVTTAEGWGPRFVNDALRELMAQIARQNKDTDGSIVATGSGNAYTLTTNRTFSAPYEGLTVRWEANHSNTGAATLTAYGVTKAIKKNFNADLVSGDIPSGLKVQTTFDVVNDWWQADNIPLTTGAVVVDRFEANGSTTSFQLSRDPGGPANIAVFFSGAYQHRIDKGTTQWTLSGKTLTFVANVPPADVEIDVRIISPYGQPSIPPNSITSTELADASVTTAKVVDNAITSGKIASGAVATTDIADDAVDTAKIAHHTAAGVLCFGSDGAPFILTAGSNETFLGFGGVGAAPSAKSITTPTISKSFTSSDQTITAGGQIVLAHGLGVVPEIVQYRLICQSDEFGYIAGQRAHIQPGTHDVTNGRGISVIIDATNITIRYGSDSKSMTVMRADNGGTNGITNASWKLRVKAFA